MTTGSIKLRCILNVGLVFAPGGNGDVIIISGD